LPSANTASPRSDIPSSLSPPPFSLFCNLCIKELYLRPKYNRVGDPWKFGADPDPTPDPTPFFSDIENAKKNFLHIFFFHIIFILKNLFIDKILFKNFILMALFQSTEHIYENREGSGSGSVSLMDPDPGGPKTCGSCGIRIRIPNRTSFKSAAASYTWRNNIPYFFSTVFPGKKIYLTDSLPVKLLWTGRLVEVEIARQNLIRSLTAQHHLAPRSLNTEKNSGFRSGSEWIRISLSCWIRNWIQEGKNDSTKKKKSLENFMF
jgi:hypothetical protein